MAEPIVEPVDTSTAAPAVEPVEQPAAAPTEEAGARIPAEVAQIPAMSALLQGQPAAASVDLARAAESPELKLLADNREPLMAAGFGTYRALSGNIGVIFNSMFIHPEELKAADKAGQLAQIAPPFDAINQAVAQSGPDAHPALIEGERPAGPKGSPMPQPPSFPAGGQPAGDQRKLNSARLKNMQPQKPSQGDRAGALLRNITKPVL